jgi:hypothetical protein
VTDGRVLVLLLLAVLAPALLALVVAMLRGYTIDIHLARRRNRGEGNDDDSDPTT